MSQWTTVCKQEDLTPNTGICALLGDEQVAIFNCSRTNGLFAIANFDPFSKANVLSRGLIGSTKDVLYVASPIYKQRFDLKTGACLDDAEIVLKTFAVRIEDQQVQLKAS